MIYIRNQHLFVSLKAFLVLAFFFVNYAMDTILDMVLFIEVMCLNITNNNILFDLNTFATNIKLSKTFDGAQTEGQPAIEV